MQRRTLLNLLIGLLLAGGFLASMPMAGGQVPQATTNAIRAEMGDSTAPHGGWTKVTDKTTFYLRRDAGLPPEETPVGTSDDPTVYSLGGNYINEAYYLDYEKPKAPIANAAEDPSGFFHSANDQRDLNDKKVSLPDSTPTGGNIPPNLDPLGFGGVGSEGVFAAFVIPPSLTQTADLRAYGLDIDVYLTCTAINDSAPFDADKVSVQGSLFRLRPDGASWTQDRRVATVTASRFVTDQAAQAEPLLIGSGQTNPVLRYTASTSVGNLDLENGDLFSAPTATNAGHRFLAVLRVLSGGTADCVLHFDSLEYPSNVKIVTDATRLNTWIETRFGDFTEGLGAPARTQSAERRFFLQTIHTSAWPSLNGYFNPRTDVANEPASPAGSQDPFEGDANTPHDYMEEFWDVLDTSEVPGPTGFLAASDLRPRMRDLTTQTVVSGTGADQFQFEERTVTHVGNSINRIQNRMFYPDTMPERAYRGEVASTVQGTALTPVVTMGLKGFTFTPLDGLVHNVSAKEPTEFRFRVRNFGGEDDTVTVVATPPGSSWVAEIVGGSTHFLRGNGGEAEVVLRVTPPDGVVAPATQGVMVTAASTRFPSEITPIVHGVTVNVVSALKRGVDVTLNRTVVSMQPGVDTTLGGVRVRNTGTVGETFLLQPVVPASAVGWTIQATPLSKLIFANSSSDFSLRIRAPLDAPAGQTFTLPLRASRLGDASVMDTVDLTVTVTIRHGLVTAFTPSTADLPTGFTPAGVFESYVTGRRNGAGCPIGPAVVVSGVCYGPGAPAPQRIDTVTDPTFLHRVLVTNPGAREDTYRVELTWEPKQTINGVAYTDVDGSSSCDTNDANRPDFWRARLDTSGTGLVSSLPFSSWTSTLNLNPVPRIQVPAGETRALYIEQQYVGPTSGCSTSLSAPMRVTLRSGNDPGLERSIELVTQLTAPGTYIRPNDFQNAVHDAEVEADWTDLDRRASAEAGQMSSHVLRIRNTGNELDNTVVTVPGTLNGWTRSLTQLGSAPSGIACTGNAAGTRFVCPLGIYEEAQFRLDVRSPDTAPIGSFDQAAVAATSSQNANSGGILEFTTAVQGTFQFDAQGLLTTINAEKGKTALLPFVLKNQGTSGDRLNLSLIQGDSAWTPRLGLPQSNFVPGGRELSGFIAVTPPADATVSKLFRLQVTSAGNGAIDIVDFTVTPVAAGALRLSGLPSNVTTIAQAGVPQQVRVNVIEPGGAAGRGVRVDVAGSLPNGWTVTPTSTTVTLAGATNPNATAVFTVTAPAGSLGNSRLPLLLDADSTSGTAVSGQGNLLLQLADVFGVKLSASGPTNQTIVPGGQVVYNMTVANLGTSTDTIRFATSGAPTGWIVQSDPPELALGPLENRTVKLLVKAPANAAPKALATTTVQASSLGSGAVSSVITTTRVGFYELLVGDGGDALDLAPTETGSLVFSVKNTGSLPDEVAIVPALANAGVASQVTMRADPAVVALAPNQTREVRLDVTMGSAPPADSDITASVRFDSRLAPNATIANVTLPLRLHVLPYVAHDVDGDGIQEYAVDRADDDNGFESYLDTGVGGGKPSQVADLGRFLTAEGVQKHTRTVALANGTTVEVVDVVVDGDVDQKRDLFVDSTGDGLPDHYWDPDEAHAHDLDIVQDVDGDAVPDYFVDTGGAAGVDAVYDLRTATFTPVLTLDIDGDGTDDYLVDKNANGKLDADETVLYSRGDGGLVAVQKIDMDSNGELDSVFDIDGDGVPDYFIPAGEEAPIEIVLKDVNGDGVADWAYDADGDGRLDSYYDPETKKASLIDAKDSFADALRQYWYIGALFGVVLALFVVLLFVTRK